ncbi:MAG: hemerythrin domain-containing protein [Betaproteobacteria bacterium]|nr:hemerythrin domain-containing protein [Betaproteobacteria bacterium]
MMRVTEALEQHHKYCDDTFAAAEEAARQGDWPACTQALKSFHHDLEQHFGVEESLLFPAFEQATGMTAGPTRMMRMEHVQMRALVEEMEECLRARDADGLAGAAETLLVLMQQHNLKEQNILYPMCDQHLHGARDLRERIGAALATETT